LLDPVASTRGAEARYEEKGLTPRQRAIVIGYGPIGRLVVRLLQENEIEPTIVELIRAARDANPKIHIVARTVRLETKKSLMDAGADQVFSAEAEMALSITECLLQSLGTTQEQLEANRDSIRKTISVLSIS
jgi:CPA2 family monovalent cation:H+ antiporter-2